MAIPEILDLLEIRYYITSPGADPVKLNHAIRSQWRVENNLHWMLDDVFNGDDLLKKKDNSAINFNIVLNVALALLEKETILEHHNACSIKR